MTAARVSPDGGWLRGAGLFPALGMVGFFLLVPLALILVYSFLGKGDYGGVVWSFSTAAYEKILFVKKLDGSKMLNWAFFVVLFRSVLLALMTTVLCLLIAFPAAFFISRQRAFVKGILLLLIMFPFWSNLLVRTSSWIILLRDHGLVNKALMWLGLTDAPLTLLYTDGAVLIGLVYVYIPFMILPVFTSVERLDKRLIEAAFDLYASRIETLRRVIVPLTMPGMVAGSILVFIPSLGAFITPDLLGGGRKLMLGSLIQLQFTTARDWPYGAAISIVLLVLVVLALALAARRGTSAKAR